MATHDARFRANAPAASVALVLRDRNKRHILELAKEWLQVGQIEPAVQRRHCAVSALPEQREVEVVGVEVKNIEAIGLLTHLLKLQHSVRERIHNRWVKP